MSKITNEELHASLSGRINKIDGMENSINELEHSIYEAGRSSYETTYGVKTFTSENGYVTNIHITGETLVNIGPMKNISGDADGIVRTRFKLLSEYNDVYVNYQRYSGRTFTFYNFTDKPIQYVGRNTSDVWNYSFVVAPDSFKVVNVPADQCVVGVDFRPVDGWSNADLSIYNSSMYMVLEGDHSDKNLTYFEGMKSLGEGDDIKLLTLTDNLLNKSDFVVGSTMSVIGDKFVIDSRTNRITHRTPIPVDMYKYLALPFMKHYNVFIYELDANDVILQTYGWSQAKYARAITPGTKYIRMIFSKPNGGNMTLNDYDKIAPYLTGKFDEQTIKVTLRSLPNGVRDEIVKSGNKYYKVQRVEEITLDGYEKWTTTTSQKNTLRLKTPVSNLAFKAGEITCTSDRFMGAKNNEWNFDREQVDIDATTINIVASRNLFSDADSFSTWLKSNPVKVVYELNTTKVIELPNFDLQTYEGETTLFMNNSAAVRGDCSFEVTSSMKDEISALREKVAAMHEKSFGYEFKGAYALKLFDGVSLTGNNVGRIVISGDNAIVTAELKADTAISTNAFIAQIPVPLVDAFHPIAIDIVGSSPIQGWVYRNGIIRTFKQIPAGSTFFFAFPALVKNQYR